MLTTLIIFSGGVNSLTGTFCPEPGINQKAKSIDDKWKPEPTQKNGA
jgi:hypothetical protein